MTTIKTRQERRPGLRQAKRRPPRGTRIVGYLIAAAINVAFIYVVNVAPGWRALPLLNEAFSRVVGLMTLSFMVSVVVNLAYVAFDPRWMKRLGDALTTAIGLVVMLRLLQVFPFDFGQWGEWEVPLRVALGLGCVGAAIGVIVNLAGLVRDLAARGDA